ncbi:MAG: hypothetical protein KDC44_13225, partial [Phaeodactylibacter sp.]|nr:hypothetical protein [Phaeodactylibacter sp.]
TDEVQVTEDVDLPVVAIGTPAILDCNLATQLLDGTASSQGTEFSYSWTTGNGLIIAGSTSTSPTIGAPGDYILTVLNQETGCENSSSTQVTQNIIAPSLSINSSDTLTCTFTSIGLSATASGNSTDLSYQWSTANGQIQSGANTLNPTVGLSGIYVLTVVDNENGCSNDQSVFVPENTVHPIVSIAAPAVLNCVTDEVILNANGSSAGPNFSLDWSTTGGSISGGQGTLSPTVNAVGTYQLVILDLSNGCSTTEDVVVNGDYELPEVDAGDDFVLPCFEDFVELAGLATAGGQPVSVIWNTASGNILSGAQSFTPAIDQGGIYTMTVMNLTNGCTGQDFLEVTEDKPLEPPVSPDLPACYGDFGSIQVGAVTGGTPPYLYSIDGGENYQSGGSFVGVAPGNYDIVVQDVNGCETPLVPVFIPQPIEVV